MMYVAYWLNAALAGAARLVYDTCLGILQTIFYEQTVDILINYHDTRFTPSPKIALKSKMV